MQISAEQLAQLKMVVSGLDLELGKEEKELAKKGWKSNPMEFNSFTKVQPFKALLKVMSIFFCLEVTEDEQNIDLVEQISIPKKLWDILEAKFKKSPQFAPYLECFHQFLYDPSAHGTSMLGFMQLGRMSKFVKKEVKKVTEEFRKAGEYLAGLGVVFAAFAVFKQDFGMFVQVCILGVLCALLGVHWKVCMGQIEIVAGLKFGNVELGRVRQSLLTGNVAQLLMRGVGKLEFLEKRSQIALAKMSDFWRQFQQEVCEEVWRDQDSGLKRARELILHFLSLKAGPQGRLPTQQVLEFKGQLVEFV